MLTLTLTDFGSSAVLRQTADTEHVHVLLDSLISMHVIFLASRYTALRAPKLADAKFQSK